MKTVLCIIVGLVAIEVTAADWPQFRHDANRSAASSSELPAELFLQWERKLPRPRPAFPNEIRLGFDSSYEPVVLGKTMFVPSMITDSVTALNTDTGEVRWRFFTDGPVRFAPVAGDGMVHFVSDDGYLYCVKADSGELVWKFRGLSQDRTDRNVLGNGRLTSLRPARGGPVLADGIVYFGAGIWLGDGIFIHALDAKSGDVVWSNTKSHLIEKTNLDHGVKGYSGLSPQGYLAVIGDTLAIPCGAQLPAFLDRKTGKLDSYTMGWGGRNGLPKGSWLVAGVGRYLVHSGDLFDMERDNDEEFKDSRGRPDFKNLLYPGGFTRLQIDPTNQRALGDFREPVVTADALYYGNAGAGIVASDLKNIRVEERAKTKPTARRQADRYPDKWKGTLAELWNLESQSKLHIKAGQRLYAGGPGVVEAIDLPAQGGEPAISWRSQIKGTPSRMLAADGKLFVVTKEGSIYAFGETLRPQPLVHTSSQLTLPPQQEDGFTQTARQVLADSQSTNGYVVVFGMGSGRLAEELIRESNLFVIGVDPDAEKVARLRERFHEAGAYGRRISLHVGSPRSFSLPPFHANLIVSEDPSVLSGSGDSQLVKSVFRSLRPYGGSAYLPIPEADREEFQKTVESARLPGLAARFSNDFTRLTREGSLPGADDWSHKAANSANTGASEDHFLKGPLAMLWFDGSVRWHRKPGSAVIRVAQGRVLILADKLLAVDVFTGRHLWEKPVPTSGSKARPEMVAAKDAIYVANGKTCFVLDPATGRTTAQIDVPAGAVKAGTVWSRVSIHDDFLVGTAGARVVCLHRKTGELIWSHECQHDQLSLAVGSESVFCAEIRKLSRKPTQAVLLRKPRTRAFSLKTGEILWEIPDASELRLSESQNLLLTLKGVYRTKDGGLVRKSDVPFFIAGDLLVTTTADKLKTFDLLTGKATSNELTWYRRGCTDLRAGSHIATTRFQGNAAYVDLISRKVTPLWNVRSACNNNLVPANGVLNVPNLTGGCECNYTPASLAFIPASVLEIDNDGK